MIVRGVNIWGWREAWEVTDFLFGGPHAPREAAAWLDAHDALSWGDVRPAALEWLGRPFAPMPPGAPDAE